MLRYNQNDNNEMFPDSKGPWVKFEEVDSLVLNYLNKIEAIDRRHREVRDAIAEERDDLRKRMVIIQREATGLKAGLIKLKAMNELKPGDFKE